MSHVGRQRSTGKASPPLVELELGLDEAEDESAVRARIAQARGVPPETLARPVVLKRSLDARRGRVRFHLLIELRDGPDSELALPHPREVSGPRRVAIVGGGPAGLFCAYELARAGVPAVVLERGKPVQPRRRDLRAAQAGHVDPESNYCFGEGGAGTFSDGKLYTRSQKRGDVRDVIEILAAHGAPEQVLSDARPHIGSNKLPKVVTALRERLEAVGVEFRFAARVVGIERGAGTSGHRVVGVRLVDGEVVRADAVVLATGHSAPEVLHALADAGVALAAKPFAVGVRIEHPQPLIDRIQYGRHAGHPRLPAASYRLSQDIDGRGVFSFCMCPGGFIVPAATRADAVVVNGMSLSRRDSPFANSGLVVAVEPTDLAAAGYQGALGGLAFLERIERAAAAAGGAELRAPATGCLDFLAGRGSSTIGETSYRPGVVASDVGAVLDAGGLACAARLRRALHGFGRHMSGYVTGEAVLVGVESRTSSPVRVPRDPERLDSPDVPGLYPCGEGAGYAGGIVSAALDGMRVARRIAAAWGCAAHS
jgi:uncharacterized FAD-dependent dehydrogenase